MAMMRRAEARYVRRQFLFMLLFVAVVWTVRWAFRQGGLPDGPLGSLIAAVPALPVLGSIWAVHRLVEDEDDEYQRLLHVRTQTLATGLTLVICTVWGWLQTFGGLPKIELYWVFFLFMIAQIPATLWVRLRALR